MIIGSVLETTGSFAVELYVSLMKYRYNYEKKPYARYQAVGTTA